MSEHAPVYVVTCAVPPGSAEELRLDVEGRTVQAASPSGFRHVFELPEDVAIEQLEWQVYAGILELRAPYGIAGCRGD